MERPTYIDCYFDVSMHCTTQPASLLILHVSGWLLLERLLWMRSIWEIRVGFTCGNIHLLLWKSYKLYLTVPLFAAMFRIQMIMTILFSPCLLISFPYTVHVVYLAVINFGESNILSYWGNINLANAWVLVGHISLQSVAAKCFVALVGLFYTAYLPIWVPVRQLYFPWDFPWARLLWYFQCL